MKLFITGISTDVGKTIASAIIVEALEADYWKPIQAGDLAHSDSHKIKNYISNPQTVIHSNSYALNTPASPHLAAELDRIVIDIQAIKEPESTNNHLVIEGAGGLLVFLFAMDIAPAATAPPSKAFPTTGNAAATPIFYAPSIIK